jgi:hypothetical protein
MMKTVNEAFVIEKPSKKMQRAAVWSQCWKQCGTIEGSYDARWLVWLAEESGTTLEDHQSRADRRSRTEDQEEDAKMKESQRQSNHAYGVE